MKSSASEPGLTRFTFVVEVSFRRGFVWTEGRLVLKKYAISKTSGFL